jgi:hypothetical protein
MFENNMDLKPEEIECLEVKLMKETFGTDA